MPATDLSLRRGQRRWYDGLSRYLALITAAITLGAAAAVFFTVGQELGGVGELLTVIVAVLGLIASLQLETLFRAAERVEARERYSRLLVMIEDYPDLFPIMTGIADGAVTTLKTSRLGQFRVEAMNTLVSADARMKELAQGRLRTADGDSALILDLFGNATELIEATTDDGDTKWWLQDNGTRFFELNQERISSGVKVERIWILSGPPTAETREVLRKHAGIGVKLYVLRADQQDLDRRLLINMTLMDGVFLHEDLPNKQGKAVEYLYSANSADLVRAQTRFIQLKAHATRYVGPESLDQLFAPPITTGRHRRTQTLTDAARSLWAAVVQGSSLYTTDSGRKP